MSSNTSDAFQKPTMDENKMYSINDVTSEAITLNQFKHTDDLFELRLTGKSVVELFPSQDPVYFLLLPDTRLPRTLIPDLEKAHKRKRMDLVVKIFCPTRSSNQDQGVYQPADAGPQTQKDGFGGENHLPDSVF
jgi:hypothetical protein